MSIPPDLTWRDWWDGFQLIWSWREWRGALTQVIMYPLMWIVMNIINLIMKPFKK